MKNFSTKSWILALVAMSIISLSSCSDDEVTPLFALAFETTEIGFDESTNQATVKVEFTSPAPQASTIKINVTEKNVAYGTDYKTDPSTFNGVLSIDVPQGADEVSFTLTKLSDFIAKDAVIQMRLNSISDDKNEQMNNALITGNTSLKISFRAINAPGTKVEAEIGGSRQPNQVFIDLNLNKQHTASRNSWDLGFYSGTKNRVILNYSTYAMAKALDKIDLNAVSGADTVGLSNTMKIGTAGADTFIDHPDGDLSKTAIAEVSATDLENKVYIINRGNKPGTEDIPLGSVGVGSVKRGWKKIRILKITNGYKIQHANIDATTFSETIISKDENFNFSYFSFENGEVKVEPVKSNWDFAFTVSSNIISFGPGSAGAYGFSDYVKTNGVNNVEVTEIATKKDGAPIEGVKTYEEFALADVSSETFSLASNAIGYSWRSVFSKTTYDYKYYIVKDTEGNYYKVQFLGLMNLAGERGNSSFKYELLK